MALYRIPAWGWVPGLSGPPDWYSGAADQNTSLDDPRWVSALRLDINDGGAPELAVRAVRNGTNQLILSIHVRHDPSTAFETTDQLWIGFNPTFAGATPKVFSFTYQTTAVENASTNLNAVQFNWNSATSSWNNTGAPPTGVSQARVWKQFAGGVTSWAYQMVIDTLAAGILAPGVTSFGMCIQARAFSPAMVVPYRLPRSMPIISGSLTGSGLNPANTGGPGMETEPIHWDTCTFDAGANTGVAIDPSRIGTNNMPTHKININAANRFVVKPDNQSGASVQIRARIRLANWGSANLWRDLLTTPSNTITHTGTETLEENWRPNPAFTVALPGGGTQDEVTFYTANKHQCILASLEATAGTVYFSRDSCVRNMDFGNASKFRRNAEISLRGIGDGFRQPQRDTYISVERVNLPAVIDDETREKYNRVQEIYGGAFDISEGYAEEQRYVALLNGDLRHVRYIKIEGLLEWMIGNYRQEQLVIDKRFYEEIAQFGVGGDSFVELIDRYQEEMRYYHAQLTYDNAGNPILGEPAHSIIRLFLEYAAYRGEITLPEPGLPPIEELEQYIPTARYHVFRDTGLRMLVDGVVLPIVEPQPAFGYYIWLDHEVQRWELRLQGAQKLGENLYWLRVPTEGEATVVTSIHAVQEGEEAEIEPPEEIVKPPVYTLEPGTPGDEPPRQPAGCLFMLAQIFDILSTVSKTIADIIRSLAGRR